MLAALVLLGGSDAGCADGGLRSCKEDVSDPSTSCVDDCDGGLCRQVLRAYNTVANCDGGDCVQVCSGVECVMNCNGGGCVQDCGAEACARGCDGGGCICEGKGCPGGETP